MDGGERIRVDEVSHLPPREMAIAMIRQVDDARLLPESRADIIIALTRVRSGNLQAQATYDLRPYDGHLTYFRTEGSAEAPLQASADAVLGLARGERDRRPRDRQPRHHPARAPRLPRRQRHSRRGLN